jgi:hypothetical protein
MSSITNNATTTEQSQHEVQPKQPDVAVEAQPQPTEQPAAAVVPVEPKLIPNPKYHKQVAMSKSYEINAWREAARRLGHLQPQKNFNAIAKKDTPTYAAIRELSKKIEEEWKAAGAIPEACRSKISAPEIVNESDYLAAKKKRKEIRETRAKNKKEKEEIAKQKAEAEARGEEFVEPKKKRNSRKRKAVEEVKEEAKAEDSAEKKTEQKPKRKRAPKKPKTEAAVAKVEAVVAADSNVAFENVSAQGKADFLPSAQGGEPISVHA